MSTVYVLQLANGCYYVGKTSDLDRRVAEHQRGEGSAWTKAHPVEGVVSAVPGDGWVEEKVTLLMMKQHSVENVRGGSYCKTSLTKADKTKATQQIASITDTCYICSSAGHFASSCKKAPRGRAASKDRNPRGPTRTAKTCARCGRKGHTKSQCYATTNATGKDLRRKCGRCRRPGHTRTTCYASTMADGSPVQNDALSVTQ